MWIVLNNASDCVHKLPSVKNYIDIIFQIKIIIYNPARLLGQLIHYTETGEMECIQKLEKYKNISTFSKLFVIWELLSTNYLGNCFHFCLRTLLWYFCLGDLQTVCLELDEAQRLYNVLFFSCFSFPEKDLNAELMVQILSPSVSKVFNHENHWNSFHIFYFLSENAVDTAIDKRKGEERTKKSLHV